MLHLDSGGALLVGGPRADAAAPVLLRPAPSPLLQVAIEVVRMYVTALDVAT